MKVPLSRPSILPEDIEAVVKVLQSGNLVQGMYVSAIENEVSARTGCTHAIAVSNGTATMHLALLAKQIGPGDEVIVPAFSYVATANVVELVGAKPVFVDVNLATFNIDAGQIWPKITKKTKAIIPVHEFGLACDMEKIIAIAKEAKLFVIEDAACSYGAMSSGSQVGGLGNVGSFSFHPRKAATSGEGGMITTSDNNLARFFRVMRNHGCEVENGEMQFNLAGFNYRMTDFQAALLMGQLKRFDTILEKRKRIARIYDSALNLAWLRKPKLVEDGSATWQTYHVVLESEIDQKSFIHFLRQNGVGANYGAQCIPIQNHYRLKYGYVESDFPNAANAFKKGIALPLFDSMTDEEVGWVLETIGKYEAGT
jgi:perosamine synthetase